MKTDSDASKSKRSSERKSAKRLGTKLAHTPPIVSGDTSTRRLGREPRQPSVQQPPRRSPARVAAEHYAFYMAGQVVAAWLYEVPVVRAVMPKHDARPDDRGWGAEIQISEALVHILTERPVDRQIPPESLGMLGENYAAVLLAGFIALRKNEAGRDRLTRYRPHVIATLVEARVLAWHFRGGMTSGEWVWRAWDRTAALFDNPSVWRAVERVAALLTPGAEIEGARLERAVAATLRGRRQKLTAPAAASGRYHPPMRREALDEKTAYHEAGHAVAARLCGLRLLEASAALDICARAYVQVRCRASLVATINGRAGAKPRHRGEAEDHIRFLLGGLAAPTKLWAAGGLTGLSLRQIRSGASKDWREAYRIARALEGDMAGARRLVAQLRAEVDGMFAVEANWRAVEELAALLPSQGIVDGATAERVIDAALRGTTSTCAAA